MDYLQFLNSDSIRDYLHEIKFIPNSEEKLFIVDNCLEITLEDKISALEKLKKEMGKKDTVRIHDFPRIYTFSATKFIDRLIKKYITLVENFKDDSGDCVYELKVSEEYQNCYYDEKFFYSYGDFLFYKNNLTETDQKSNTFRLKKIYLNSINNDACGGETFISAIYSGEFKLMDIKCSGFSDEKYKVSSDNLICCIPLPFKSGDIIVRKKNLFNRTASGSFCPLYTPCVFTKACPTSYDDVKTMDASDLILYTWYRDNSTGLVKHDHFEHRYDFEFLKDKLSSKDKILYSVSAFLKKTIDEEPLVLTALYHQVNNRILEQMNEREDLLLNYIYSDNEKKVLLRQQYAKNKDMLKSFDASDDSIKIWLDDLRNPPSGYYHCHSVNEVIKKIRKCEQSHVIIEELNLDHDLGDFASDGGDTTKLLDFLVQRQTFYRITLHTANPVGRNKMQRIIDRYWHTFS